MKHIVWLLSVWLVLGLTSTTSLAQCAMCQASIESSESSQATFKQRAKGLNSGILYLMCIPYLLAGIIGFVWYRSSKKERDRKNKVQSIIRSKMSQV